MFQNGQAKIVFCFVLFCFCVSCLQSLVRVDVVFVFLLLVLKRVQRFQWKLHVIGFSFEEGLCISSSP